MVILPWQLCHDPSFTVTTGHVNKSDSGLAWSRPVHAHHHPVERGQSPREVQRHLKVTEMWLLIGMLKIPWAAKRSKEEVIK